MIERRKFPHQYCSHLCIPLSQGLVEKHAGSDRDVQALDTAALRQAHHVIAVRLRQVAQARAFRTEHQYDAGSQIDLARLLRSGRIRTHHPQPRILEQLQRAHQVGDRDHRGRLGSPAGDLAHRRIHLCSPVLRDHERQCAAGIGGAQARTEVMRVLHAIQRQDDRRAYRRKRVQQIILGPGCQRGDLRCHALVADVAEQVLERVGIDALQRPAVTLGEFPDGTRARILAALRQQHVQHALRLALEQRPDCMHAVDGLRGLHRRSRQRRARFFGISSSARLRSISPSIGFTEVTTTLMCEPVLRRRPLRRPRQACPPSSIWYSSSRRLSRCSRPSTPTSMICTKQPNSTTVVMSPRKVWPTRSAR